MSKSDHNETSQSILEAIRSKREHKVASKLDIESLEAALLADIEAFDLDSAVRLAELEQISYSGTGWQDSIPAFPNISADSQTSKREAVASRAPDVLIKPPEGGGLLSQLRQQASIRQQELHSQENERNAANQVIYEALKSLFFYLHDLVQQLNIVKPSMPRRYPLIDDLDFSNLLWDEGFADYRTQAQSAGAVVELVNFSYQLQAPKVLSIERDGPYVERFRAQLFDYGLQFSCKEFRNDRRYVERAEFTIQSKISVSARWQADFVQGKVILETRNLERLGSISYQIRPELIDQTLLDEFGRMVLGQPNRFRDLIRRLD